MRRRLSAPLVLVAASIALSACGSESVKTSRDNGPLKGETDPVVLEGASLFADRCAGCHTLAAAGTQGGAFRIKDRERTDGPNFDLRAESKGNVLYALRNGGFSGAIMPQNIAVGEDADKIASFLCKYSGLKAVIPASPVTQESTQERCSQTGPTPPASR